MDEKILLALMRETNEEAKRLHQEVKETLEMSATYERFLEEKLRSSTEREAEQTELAACWREKALGH